MGASINHQPYISEPRTSGPFCGKTWVMLASSQENIEQVKILLRAKANVHLTDENGTNKNGKTALQQVNPRYRYYSKTRLQREIITLLKQYGAKPDCVLRGYRC